jgi:hypothetical protein
MQRVAGVVPAAESFASRQRKLRLTAAAAEWALCIAEDGHHDCLKSRPPLTSRGSYRPRGSQRRVYFKDILEGTYMDIHILIGERRRIADQFRSTLTCLGILRAQVIGAGTEEARHHLLAAIEDEAEVCRGLGDRLLQLDAKILAMQTKRSDPEEGMGVSLDPHVLESNALVDEQPQRE